MKPGLLKTMTCLSLVLTLLSVSTSCVNSKKLKYFPALKDGSIPTTAPFMESVIQKNDILSISVSSLNPDATNVFNGPNSPAGGAGATATAGGGNSGYLVNGEGFIQFPILGNIKAAGLTKNQLKDTLTRELVDGKYLIDPILSIRFVNFRVTVLGEVNHPSVVTIPNEKVSILEAIGLAGDLTIYGQKNNVLIIREEKDQKIVKRINLNTMEIFSSPYYYLQSNDIVYVEPNKAKIASMSRTNQILPLIFSGLSLVILIQQAFDSNK